MTESVTEQDVEQKPDEQQAPETSHEPGEAPIQQPEPAEPETPSEPEPEPEAPKDDVAKVPETMTKAGRERARRREQKPKPKRQRRKAKPKADKPKPTEAEKQAAKDKERMKELRAEYTHLNKVFDDRGYTAQDARRMRFVCGKLERSVPKWAQTKGRDPDAKPRIVNDADLRLAHRMTAYVMHDKVNSEGLYTAEMKAAQEAKGIKFGASYVTTHVEKIRDAFKGKDILKALGGISRKDLERFALYSSQNPATEKPELSPEVKKAIREFVKANFQPIDKIWARKVAGGAVILLQERDKAKRSKAAAAKRKTTASAKASAKPNA